MSRSWSRLTSGRSSTPADDAENGGVGANPQGQREDDGDGQAFGPDERTKGEFEVGDEVHDCFPTRILLTVPAHVQ